MVLLAVLFILNSELCALGFELKVLTYNVAGIPVLHGRVAARSARIAELIKRDGYDIAAFQECWYKDCVAALSVPFDNVLRLRDGIVGGDGLITASRLPIENRELFTYSINAPIHRFLYGEADGIASKGVVVATVRTPAGPIHVFNTHLLAGYPGRNYVPERVGQIYELAAFIRAYAKDEPYLLLGDLNLNPKSLEYPILVSLLELRDACTDCAATGNDGRIDHIFLSPAMAGWTVERAAVVMTESLDDKKRIPLSDHLGIAAVLKAPVGKAKAAQAKGISRERALQGVIESLDRFISDTSRAVNLNILIPFYGWSHGRWALRQADAAKRIQDQALSELASLNVMRNLPRRNRKLAARPLQ